MGGRGRSDGRGNGVSMKERKDAENKQVSKEQIGFFGGVNKPEPKEEPKEEDVKADEPE